MANKGNMMEKISVSVTEAAEMLSISKQSLYKIFKEGKITPRQFGDRKLILVEDLKHYVENLPAAS